MLSFIRRLVVVLTLTAVTELQAAQVNGVFFTSQGREVQVIYDNTFENPSFVSFAYRCTLAEPCDSSTIATQVYRDFIDANLRGRFYTYSIEAPCQALDPNQCLAAQNASGHDIANAKTTVEDSQQATTLYPAALAGAMPALLDIAKVATVEYGVNKSLDTFVAEVGKRAQQQIPALANPLHIITLVGADGTAVAMNLCQVKGKTCEVPPEYLTSVTVRINGNLAVITINVTDLLAFDTGVSMMYQAIGFATHAGTGGGECRRETVVHSKNGENVTITCYMNLP